jgi:peroxiredoxin
VELQSQYGAFQEAGAEVVALAVAPIEAVTNWCQRAGLTYPMLADPDYAVSAAYGVYNLYGDGLAAPAVFVINTDGRIVWHYVGSNPADRPGAQTILEHLP